MADNLIIKIDGDAAGFEKELKAISNAGKAGTSTKCICFGFCYTILTGTVIKLSSYERLPREKA